MPLQLFFPYHSQCPNAFLLRLPFPALHHHFRFRKLPCLLPSEVFASVQKQAVFFLLAWTEVGIGHEDGVFGKRVMLWMRCRTWGSFWNKGFWRRRFLNSFRQVLGLLVKILFWIKKLKIQPKNNKMKDLDFPKIALCWGGWKKTFHWTLSESTNDVGFDWEIQIIFFLCHSFMVLGLFLSFSLLTCEMVLTQLLYPPFNFIISYSTHWYSKEK